MSSLNANANDGISGANASGTSSVVHANAFADTLMKQVLHQLPLSHAAAHLTVQLVQQVKDIVRDNILALGGLISAAGMAMLLPTLTLVIVNALGFTSGGVLAGSIAALIQSQVYGAFTGGLFSVVQSFGATAVVAPPVVLAIGGVLLLGGIGFAGWELWKRYKAGSSRREIALDSSEPDDKQKLILTTTSMFNPFNLFKR